MAEQNVGGDKGYTFVGYAEDGSPLYERADGRIVDAAGNKTNKTVFSSKKPGEGDTSDVGGGKKTTRTGHVRNPVFTGASENNNAPATQKEVGNALGLMTEGGQVLSGEEARLIRLSHAKNAVIEYLFPGGFAEYYALQKAGDPRAQINWEDYGLGRDANVAGYADRTKEAGKAIVEGHQRRQAEAEAKANRQPNASVWNPDPNVGIYKSIKDAEGKYTPSQETVDLLKQLGLDPDTIDWEKFGEGKNQLNKKWEGDMVPSLRVVNGQKIYEYGGKVITEDEYKDLLAAQVAKENKQARPDVFTDAMEKQEDGTYKYRNPYTGALGVDFAGPGGKRRFVYDGQEVNYDDYKKIEQLQSAYKQLYAPRPTTGQAADDMAWEYQRREAQKRINDYYKNLAPTTPAPAAPAAAGETAKEGTDTTGGTTTDTSTNTAGQAQSNTTPAVSNVAGVAGTAGSTGLPAKESDKNRRPSVFKQNQQTQLDSNQLGVNGNSLKERYLPFGG